ncbi:MFS transporter [Brevibacillus ginsengisoli]|uniref:MFS transporter n=1 Tax=Brevibacillus ginsengisoli TaxID=363854 RepID=UPI003CE9EA49
MFTYSSKSIEQRIGLMLVITILFIDMLLYSLLIPITPYLTELLHPSSTMIGILFGSYAVALLAFTPIFGPLSDRIGRKKPLLIGLAGMVLSTLLFAYANSMWMLITARFMQGVGAAATWTSALALLADLFPPNKRGTVMGMALTGISTGSLLGAPLGGWLLDIGGYQTPFLFAAGLSLVTIVLVVYLLPQPERIKQNEQAAGGTFRLLRNRSVLFIAIVVLLSETTLTLLEPIIPVFLTEQLALSSTAIGLLFAASILAYGGIAPISGALSNRFNPRSLMLIGLSCLALTLPLIAMSHTTWQHACALIAVGASVGFALSPTLPSLSAVVDNGTQDGAYGSAFALFNMFHAVGMIAGPLIGGALTDWLSVPSAIWTISSVLLLGVILLHLYNRHALGNRKNATQRNQLMLTNQK